MDLEFSPEQLVLRDLARRLCAQYCGLDVVRRLEQDTGDDAAGYDPEFWRRLAESGLTGLAVPERFGGAGASLLDSVVLYEELGASLAPSPHFVSAVAAAGVLAAAGTAAQQKQWLAKIASGAAVVSVAWLEPDRGFGPEGVALDAAGGGTDGTGGWRLTGVKWHVPFAAAADRLLVLARTAAGPTLFLVDPRGAGVRLDRQRTIAGDAQFAVAFDAAAGELVGPVGGGWPIWSAVLTEGIVLLAAQAVGGARRTLEMAVEHAKTRHQFGKPLGAFQALGHYLADAATLVDGVQTLVWEAAWARDAGRPVDRLAPMAKLAAGDAFRDVTAVAQQIFGGVGFTVDYDVQLYFRRAKQWQLSWWDPRHLEGLVADQILGAL